MKTIKFLNEGELKSLFSDVKVIGKSYKWRNSFDVDFKADGTYSGTWTVNDNIKCMTENGKNKCAMHYKEGSKYYTVKENIVTSEFTIKK